jgi:hypothetical protein
MKNRNIAALFFLLLPVFAKAQYKEQLSDKVSVLTSRNVETYFFAEKLAVERIGYYVFDRKGGNYTHQPVVHFGFRYFERYKDDPVVIRIAGLLHN